MEVAILGGTGDIGEGLALRWGRDTAHAVTVGSRDDGRARDAAADYRTRLEERGHEATIDGAANPEAATGADVVVVGVPPYHVADTVEAVADGLSGVLVSPAVGMQRDEAGMHYHRPGAGSVTAVAADAAPGDVPVVGAFHPIPAHRLADLDAELGLHVPVVADDDDARETVVDLADDIDGLTGLDGGPLANAPEIEGLTPLLINLARRNEDLSALGVRFE
jgi:NADPH-dependent F420 reductase